MLALGLGVLTACSAGPVGGSTAVPTFASSDVRTSGAAAPRIGLPEDCGTFLAPDDLGALFARPLGSTAMRTIKGVPEPTVGRTERVGCRYSASGPGGGNTLLDINLGRYADTAAATRQWQLNTNAERSDGQSRDLAIGTAKAVAVERRTETLLAVVYGVDTLTFVLPVSARAPGPPVDRLVDLALRVLPRDGASQPSPPDTPAAPPATPTTTEPNAVAAG
ncbi:hypothetical protein GCM10023175_56230 [Pseudonocardia xishanensis]|uniref:DUF3558 domain-containing protein n=2 Tax=Pseudonocardia xishanensis TaxID=630995 RepID=A0ABP8RZD5_9PSEU